MCFCLRTKSRWSIYPEIVISENCLLFENKKTKEKNNYFLFSPLNKTKLEAEDGGTQRLLMKKAFKLCVVCRD